MEIYDTIVLLLVLGGAFFGWRKGLATQVASIVSIGVSYFVAVNFRDQVAQHINAAPPWNQFAAMLALYIGSSLIIWLVFRQVRSTIEAMKLKEFDYQMGALFGAAKGFIFACIVTLFAITLLHETQRQAIVHSRSGNLIAHFLHRATPIMPGEVRNYLAPIIEQLDAEMQLRRARQYAGEGEFSPTPIPPQNTFPGSTTNPGYQQPGYQQPTSGQYGGNGNVIPPAYGGNPTYGQQPYGRTAGNQPTYQGGNTNPGGGTTGYPNQSPGYGNSNPNQQYQPPNPWPQSTGTPAPGANQSSQDWRANPTTGNGRF